MHSVSVFKSRLSQAARISRLAGALQTVNGNQFTLRYCFRPLLVYQYLYAGLGLVESFFDRKALLIASSRPEVTGQGQ